MKKLDVARRFFVMLALTVSGALAIVLLSPLFAQPEASSLRGLVSLADTGSARDPLFDRFQKYTDFTPSPYTEKQQPRDQIAEATPAPGYNYVVLPGPEATGINDSNNAEANYAASWPRINFTIRDPSGATGSSVAYIPNEFLVVSSTPSVSFELRGGRWDFAAGSADAYDARNADNNPPVTTQAANEEGFNSPMYYEVYQLSNGAPQNGASCFYFSDGSGNCGTAYPSGGKRLGVINPRDASIFPGRDTNPGSQNCTGGNCWRSFSINTNGGNITPNGGPQRSCAVQNETNCNNNTGFRNDSSFNSGTFEGVNAGMRFNGSTMTNLNGYYVFLIKTVGYQDIDRGYFTHVQSFDGGAQGYGCVNNLPGAPYGVITCPNAIRNKFPFSRAAPVLENGYFIRASQQAPAGGAQYIATAPMNLALSLDWGLSNSAGDEMGDGPRGEGRPYYSLRMASGGSLNRTNGNLLWNADWDSRKSSPADDEKGDRISQPFAANRRISGYIARPSMGWRHIIPVNAFQNPAFGISDNWADDVGPMIVNMDWPGGQQANGVAQYEGVTFGNPFPPPTWQNMETQPSWNFALPPFNPSSYAPPYTAPGGMDSYGTLDIRYWNHSNDILLGGQAITTGQWPDSTPFYFNLYTPKTSPNYLYNGRDSYTLINNQTQSNLYFSFGFGSRQGTHPSATVRSEVLNESSQVIKTSAAQAFSNVTGTERTYSPEIDVRDLSPNTDYYWRACGISHGQCSGTVRFRVNGGPTATITSTPPNFSETSNSVSYRCSQLTFTLNDPEGHSVLPSATVTWTDQNGTNVAQANPTSAAKSSGSQFTGDELRIASWTVNGQSQSVPGNTTLTQFLNDSIPPAVNFTLSLRGADTFGASDSDNLSWATASVRSTNEYSGGPYPGILNPPLNQTPVNNSSIAYGMTGIRKFGPANARTYTMQTPPEFESESKKEFLDQNGNVISTVADGQTVQVRTTIVNGGETATPFYAIKDYLGALRDFTKPTNVTVTTPTGGTRVVPASQVRAVESDRDNADNDQVITEPLDTQSQQYRNGEWSIDVGQTGGAYLPAAALQPGEAVVIQYTVTANRNQNITPGDTQQGDFTRKLTPSDTHFWIEFQEETCDANSITNDAPDVMGASVQAPFLRTLRGSVGSNRSAFGYSDNLSGDENATFLVQTGGNLSHFNAANNSSEIANYTGQQTGCSDPDIVEGGVDWRTEMIKNIQKLNSGSKNTNLNPLLNPGSGQPRGRLDSHGSNVWVVGSPTSRQNLDINDPIEFEGVGTILVFGDLNINANLTYDDDTSKINSVGFIVVGNINIAPSVTELVGSYYALDSDPSIGADGCAVNVQNGRGIISTGASSLALDVQGLMVARGFNFERFFVNPNDTVPDPAEDVYYDGRVLANTPPGFGTFRNTSAWYEIAP